MLNVPTQYLAEGRSALSNASWRSLVFVAVLVLSSLWIAFGFGASLASFALLIFSILSIYYTLFRVLGLICQLLLGRGGEVLTHQVEPIGFRANRLKFSMLLPLYKEAAIVEQLVSGLSKMVGAEVEFLLVIEGDDPQTLSAANAAILGRDNFKIIVVPLSFPRTKAKACNYALNFCKGDIVGIFDAEDLPDLDQLQKVEQLFFEQGPRLVVQCKLEFYNSQQNFLSQLFQLEYQGLFGVMNALSSKIGMPFLLGGSSNYFWRSELLANQAWDAYNVTEDAELATRLAQSGYRFIVLDSITYEQSPANLGIWMNQRSRWIKGYFQTLLQFVFSAKDKINGMGLWKYLHLLIMLQSGCIGHLGFVYSLVFCWYLKSLGLFGAVHWTITSLAIISYLAYLLLMQFKYGGGKYLVIQPFYYLLHFWAAHLALYKLLTKPFSWDKTPHHPISSALSTKVDSVTMVN